MHVGGRGGYILKHKQKGIPIHGVFTYLRHMNTLHQLNDQDGDSFVKIWMDGDFDET